MTPELSIIESKFEVPDARKHNGTGFRERPLFVECCLAGTFEGREGVGREDLGGGELLTQVKYPSSCRRAIDE